MFAHSIKISTFMGPDDLLILYFNNGNIKADLTDFLKNPCALHYTKKVFINYFKKSLKKNSTYKIAAKRSEK